MAHDDRRYGNYDSRANRIAGGILIIIVSLLCFLSLVNALGGVGRMISSFLIGVFGYASFAYSIVGTFIGVMVTFGKRVTLPLNKTLKYLSLFYIALLALHVWFSKDYFLTTSSYGAYLKALYNGESAAGLLYGIVAWLFMKVLTPAYSIVALILLFAVLSIFTVYPVLVNRLPYRTKSTKIKANKKGESPVLTDIADASREERIVEQPIGNKLFVGSLNENGSDKSKKAKNRFSLLFPNQDTAGVTADSVKEPVFDTDDVKRKRAKEKLYGKKDDKKVEESGKTVTFGTANANGEEDIKPSLDSQSFTFNRDGGKKRPQTLKEAFDLPESDEEKARDIQERFGYILDTPTTANDIRGAASKRIAEPRRKKPDPVPEKKEEKKNDNGIPEGMPYFIRDILYGDKDKKNEKTETKAAKPDEEVVAPSYKPIEKPADTPVMKSINHTEPAVKPVEKPEVKKESDKSSGTGSIFTMFGAPLPEKKNSGTVKPVNKVEPEKKEPAKPEEIAKPVTNNVYERPATDSEKTEKVLPKLSGDGYNSGYEPDNTPPEKPMTRFEEMQAESKISDAKMPTDKEINDTFNPTPVAKPVEKPRQPYAPREEKPREEQRSLKDTSYGNTFPVGKNAKTVSVSPAKKDDRQISIDQSILLEQQKKPYYAPPIDLLNKGHSDIVAEDFSEKIEKLEQVFMEFNINAKVVGVTQGPTFSRFELQMPAGISVSNVTKYADDIAMKLQVKGAIRFETPIPGKDAFGIEVANDVRTPVLLRSVLEGEKFNRSNSELTFALGKDIANQDVVCDLESMPHLLIAGGTGSGKSICINGLIVSLLYRNGPSDLKLILIDPKMVEMGPYNGIPHLLVPEAIDDVAAAVNSLDWAINEMRRRFSLFKGISARNISEYNQYAREHEGVVKLPRIVIIFDELADFMSQQKRNIEDKINSLARLARASGIHLIISTQRPSVDVITGTIKSNLPSRIAFSLKTAADSSTILGEGGAEKLLGKGDMLYYPQSFNEPERLQGCFVSTEEVSAVVKYIKEHNEAYFDPDVQNSIFKQPEEEKEPEEVPQRNSYAHTPVGRNGESKQFIDALQMCVKEQKASISRIQRKFGVGYGTAANLVELMEEKGYVSPNKGGNTQRDVLISMEQFMQIYGSVAENPDSTEFDLPEDGQ